MNNALLLTKNLMLVAEIVAAISATIFYLKRKNSNVAKLLAIALCLVALTESLGWLMHNKIIPLYQNSSYWLYNLMFPTWKTIYLIIFYKLLTTKNFKKTVGYFIISYLILIPINWIFIQDFFIEIESIPYIISSFFISISSIFYLIELLKSDKIIVFHRKLMFWISIGLLVFYTGIIPFIIVRDFYMRLNYWHELFLIIYILGIIMYTLFTFGFIWSKKE